MRAISRTELLLLAPAAVFLFILPFPHTVSLRLLCLFASAVIAVVLWRRLQPPSFPLKLPILLWAVVLLSSLTGAVDPSYSLRELKNELGYTLLAFTTLFVLTRDEERLRWLCLAVVASLVVIALAAGADYARAGAWGGWTFYGGIGTISTYFITAAPIAALAVTLWKPPRVGVWLTAAAILVLGAGLLSGQRALWPALGAQLAVGCLWAWRIGRVSWNLRRALTAAALVLGIVAGGLWASEQLRTHGDSQSPAAAVKDLRPRLWLAIADRLREHPWQGVGFGQRAMVKACPELVPPENPLLWHAHNLVLNYGIYAGLPGVAAVLVLFAALFWRFWRISLGGEPAARLAGLAGAAMVAGVFTRNLFNDFFIRDGALLFWALAGMLLGYAVRKAR